LWQRLSVGDNGPGIAPEILERIFEPFFTTKAIGQGTGLGLAMVWHTIEDLGGWMDVESGSSRGTQFNLYLPVAVETTAPAPSVPAPVAAGGQRPHRLLLVEDEELVGHAISAMLRRLGQTVVWVRSGDEALAKLEDGAAGFDALLTDLNMPGLGGEELIGLARAAGFREKVVVLSGYISPEVAQRLRAAGVVALVQKPFEFERIKTLVAELWRHDAVS